MVKWNKTTLWSNPCWLQSSLSSLLPSPGSIWPPITCFVFTFAWSCRRWRWHAKCGNQSWTIGNDPKWHISLNELPKKKLPPVSTHLEKQNTPSATRKKSMAVLSAANKHRPRQFWRKRGWFVAGCGCMASTKPSARPMVMGLYSTPPSMSRLFLQKFVLQPFVFKLVSSALCPTLNSSTDIMIICSKLRRMKLESSTKIHGIIFPRLSTQPVGSTFTTAWSLGRWWCSTARRSCFSISCRCLSRTVFF